MSLQARTQCQTNICWVLDCYTGMHPLSGPSVLQSQCVLSVNADAAFYPEFQNYDDPRDLAMHQRGVGPLSKANPPLHTPLLIFFSFLARTLPLIFKIISSSCHMET